MYITWTLQKKRPMTLQMHWTDSMEVLIKSSAVGSESENFQFSLLETLLCRCIQHQGSTQLPLTHCTSKLDQLFSHGHNQTSHTLCGRELAGKDSFRSNTACVKTTIPNLLWLLTSLRQRGSEYLRFQCFCILGIILVGSRNENKITWTMYACMCMYVYVCLSWFLSGQLQMSNFIHSCITVLVCIHQRTRLERREEAGKTSFYSSADNNFQARWQ